MMGQGMEKTRWTLPNGEVVLFPRGLRQDAALSLVEAGDRLLDVGCGRGAVAALLSTRFRSVHGVDSDEEVLAEARRRGVSTQHVDLDRDSLPYEDGSFDAALCLEVIEHVLDPPRLVRELARILRPGGRLYLSTPNVRFLGYLRTLVIGGRFPDTSADPAMFRGGHVQFFTFCDVEELLRAAGFDHMSHRGLAAGRARVAARFVPARFAREFLSVGIFCVARRGAGPPPEAAPARLRERRSA
jgi:methionine biosynthesis protein MetW